MREENYLTRWNIPVSRKLNEALEAAIKTDWHTTKAEFIRSVVREKLKELGFEPPKSPDKTRGMVKV